MISSLICIYFITFTCYKWLSLFHQTNAYDAVYKWFNNLFENKIYVTGYVIMPNMYIFFKCPNQWIWLSAMQKDFWHMKLKKIEREKCKWHSWYVTCGCEAERKKKGQIHKVFQDNFDAKECYSEQFIFQKLDYIHHNPVSKKWQLVKDFTDYEYSSASFYEKEIKKYEKLVSIHNALHNGIPGSPHTQGSAAKTPGWHRK